MAATTVPNETTPVESAVRELRVCRDYMLGIAKLLDAIPEREAHHALLLSLTSLDDCLAALEHPGLFGDHRDGSSLVDPMAPTQLLGHLDDVFVRRDTIADDRRDDLMADADRSH
jgi:hypothetical protein